MSRRNRRKRNIETDRLDQSTSYEGGNYEVVKNRSQNVYYRSNIRSYDEDIDGFTDDVPETDRNLSRVSVVDEFPVNEALRYRNTIIAANRIARAESQKKECKYRKRMLRIKSILAVLSGKSISRSGIKNRSTC